MSISKKFSLLIITALAFLALGIGFFSSHSVEKSMSEAQLQGVKNSVALGTLNAQSLHRTLFDWRIQEASHTKKNMQSIQTMIASLIKQAPKTPLKEILKTFPLPAGMTLFAYNRNSTILAAHGEKIPALKYFSTLKDIKGHFVANRMYSRAKQGKTATCLIRAHNGSPQKYYGTHKWVPERGVVIAAWTDIGKIQNKEKVLFEALKTNLSSTLQTINHGSSGYVFIVDSKGKLIVPAPDLPNDISPLTNAETNQPLLTDLQQAALTPSTPITCSLPIKALSVNSGRRWMAYVDTIKALQWHIVGVAYLDEIQGPGKSLSLRLFFAMLGGTLLVTAGAIFLSRKLTTPLQLLTQYAHTIPEKDFMQDEKQDPLLKQMASAESADEIRRLAASFLFMDSALRQRVKELMATNAQKERLTGELNAAHDIQMGLLPSPLSPEHMINCGEISAYLTPAKEIGGDLYDFFMLDDDRLCIVIGDVSDKGVPAALFMSMTMTLIRSGARQHSHPADLMEIVNNTLGMDNPKCMFVTLFIGILDIKTGELKFANGGHNPLLVLHEGNTEPTWLENLSGPVVGAMPGIDYMPHSITLEKGDILFAYTDGVTEAMNSDKELFGEETLKETFIQSTSRPDASPSSIIDTVKDAVAAHAGEAPQSDDITMLCLHYDPKDKQNS